MKIIRKNGDVYEEDKDEAIFGLMVFFSGLGQVISGLIGLIGTFFSEEEEPKKPKKTKKKGGKNRKKQTRKNV